MSPLLSGNDVITACATPTGTGALAIVRLSGKNSFFLIQKIFSPFLSNRLKLEKIISYHQYFGTIINPETKSELDQVMIVFYKDLEGFVGEEGVEISCHGGLVVVREILEQLIKLGARLAEPGEFSKRAYLNKRLGLSQLEAVNDIIHAHTIQAKTLALNQLKGKLHNKVETIKLELLDIRANLEVEIEYALADEFSHADNVMTYTKNEYIDRLEKQKSCLADMLKYAYQGKVIQQGIEALILGRVNVGKSTLFNYLLNQDRAIVSDIPGTTRDVLEGYLNIEGIAVHIYDSAGLRESDDKVEEEGAKRAKQLAEKLDIIIYVCEAHIGIIKDDVGWLTSLLDQNKRIIICANKCDLLTDKLDENIILDNLSTTIRKQFSQIPVVFMSALKNQGVCEFNNAFTNLVFENENISHLDNLLITNLRHETAVEKAVTSIEMAIQLLLDNEALDIISLEIKESIQLLAEISGEVSSDHLLDKIFSQFCVGK